MKATTNRYLIPAGLRRRLKKIIHVSTIYGRDDTTPYMLRVIFFQRFRIHVMYRADEDRDPHDHPFSFTTFPLNGYFEEVFDPKTGKFLTQVVKPFRTHYRPAEYAHRILGPALLTLDGWLLDTREKPKKVTTLVWASAFTPRKWGFWIEPDAAGLRRWVPSREYLGDYGE